MASRRTGRHIRILLVTACLAVFIVWRGPALRAPVTLTPLTWQDDRTGMEFVRLGPGTFRMGTPATEDGRELQEILHDVTLTPFYMSRYEVTQGEWLNVMGQNPSRFQDCGEKCPVENVNWFEVQRFIHTLNAQGRPGFRLPTEAEWEYACRAGGAEAFGHNAALGPEDANINGQFPYNAPAGGFRGRPLPVGSFTANAWGLFDMSGNVWEWTEDWSCSYTTHDRTDPVGKCGSDTHIIRGGSWLFDGNSARCGLRYTHRPQDRGPSLGVRLVHDAW
jgi:formylglycine-generating enzyme required for sulfatase activity